MNRIKSANLLILPFIYSLLNGVENYGAIGTSRPGAANPTSSIPTGLYQFEIGANFTTNQGGIDTSITFPILIRMGLFNNTEWQVGFSNKYLTLGILYGEISIIEGLENSFIFTTSLTQNNDSLTEYSVYLPISYSFRNGYSIWGQIAGTFIKINKCSNENYFTKYSCLDADWKWENNINISDPIIDYSLAIGNSLDDRTNWFFEVNPSEILKLKDDENNPFSIVYGATFLLDNNNAQFDFSMGLTFQKNGSIWKTLAAENYIEWGFSFRLPE